MRYLLSFALCFASTTLAFGDETNRNSDPEPKPVTESEPVRKKVDPPSPFRSEKRDTSDAVPSEIEGATNDDARKWDDTNVWRPRLQVILRSSRDISTAKTVMEGVPISRSSHHDSLRDVGANFERNREVQVLTVPLAEVATLYCDTMTLNVLEGGDTPSYVLECKSRVSITLGGGVILADSASLKDGKCELVNATFTHGELTLTGQQLTLNVPIHGVVTNSFGRAIPENSPALKPFSKTPANERDGVWHPQLEGRS